MREQALTRTIGGTEGGDLRTRREEVHLFRTESYVGRMKGFLKISHSFRTENWKNGKRLA